MQTGAIGVNGNAVVLSKQSQFDKTLPTRASSPHQRDKNDLPNQKHGCGTKEHNLHWYSNNDGCGMFCGSVTWMLLLFAEYCIIHVVLDLKYVDLVRVDIISHINGNEMASVLNSNQQDGGNAATISSSSPSSISSNIDEQQGLSLAFKLLNAFLYSLFIILALTSHLRAMLTNPGATPHDAVPLEYNGDDNMKIQQERYCKYCDAYKPPRAHHCSICGRCIVKMDHHCPWVNNCVGVGNQKYFVLFLLYTFISCVYTLFLVGFKFGHCSNSRFKVAENGAIVLNDKLLPECEDLATRTILQILVIIEAILFGLFTFCMMCDQWNMAVFAETQIDRLKGGRRRGRKWTKCENLSEVFGGPPRFSFWWLLPVSFAYLNPDRIYGFRTRDKTSNVNRSSSTQDGSSSSSFDNQGHFNDIENEIVEPQSLPKASKEFIDPESQSDTRYESKRDD